MLLCSFHILIQKCIFEQMKNNEQDPLGEKRFRMESWILSRDAVEIKSLMAFRKKKNRQLTDSP